MTDNEIIKALETEIRLAEYVDSDYCSNVKLEIIKSALDLINRQRAEIERLKQRIAVCEAANRCIVWQRDRRDREIEELHSQIAGLNIYKSKIKAEAYKEFVERLKEKFVIADCIVTIDNNDIDNLLKEMIGENNG